MHFTVPNFIELINIEWNHMEIFYTEFMNQDSKMEIMGRKLFMPLNTAWHTTPVFKKRVYQI
jgi:hypothetical protein